MRIRFSGPRQRIPHRIVKSQPKWSYGNSAASRGALGEYCGGASTARREETKKRIILGLIRRKEPYSPIPYGVVRRTKCRPKYRIVRRSLSTRPNQIEASQLLENLQAITFAKYNEVHHEIPRPGRQEGAIEPVEEAEKNEMVAARRVDPISDGTRLVEEMLALRQGSRTETSLKRQENPLSKFKISTASSASSSVVQVAHMPVPSPHTEMKMPTKTEPSLPVASRPEPRLATEAATQPAPPHARPEASSASLTWSELRKLIKDSSWLSNEEIEQIYLKSLKPANRKPRLALEQLQKRGLPNEGRVSDMPTEETEGGWPGQHAEGQHAESQQEEQVDEARSRLDDPPYPSMLALSEALQKHLSPESAQEVLQLGPEEAEQLLEFLIEREEEVEPKLRPIPEWIPSPDLRSLSQQVYHILGFDVRSKYLVNRLSGSLARPPVRWLVRDPLVPASWELFGRQVTLYRDRIAYRNRRIIPQVVHSYRPGQFVRYSRTDKLNDNVIDHLFVTVPARSVVPEIRPLAHRINEKTTIVLIQSGLGIPEDLNHSLFQDPKTRPAYIEGHLSSLLYSIRDDPFAVREVASNPLYLSTRMKDPDVLVSKFPDRRLYGPTRLLQGLANVADLSMVPCARAKFLFHKLPSMMALALIEPLSVLVDGRYAKIPRGYPNNRLIERLLMEMCAVVGELPEFRPFPQAREYFNYDRGKIRNRLLAMLKKRAMTSHTSEMWRLIKNGKVTDITYLNGYFSRRAEEMGLKTPATNAIISLVKAQHEAKVVDLKNEIAFEPWINNF